MDNTYIEAIIESGTAAVLTTVQSTPDAIGYISLGSLNDTVKAVQVEGVDATVENILAGTYVLCPSVQHRHQGRSQPPGRRFYRLDLL